MISKRNHFILALGIVLAVSGLSFGFDGGDGTEGNPYQISTAEQLVSIGSNEGLLDKHYILTADIDLAGREFVTAVIAVDDDNSNYEFDGIPFTGVFDGQGFIIRNLYINTLDDEDADNDDNFYLGLFGMIGEGGMVEDLGIEGCDITAGEMSRRIGILAGANGERDVIVSGTIKDCHTIGSIQANKAVGGLVGSSYGNISDCYSSCSITATRCWAVGGLAGYQEESTITGCYSSGIIRVLWDFNPSSNVGGLVGISKGDISLCFSGCTVIAEETSYTGGLVGYCSENTISNCYAADTAEGYSYVGGLIGYCDESDVVNCYSTSYTYGVDSVGGLIGTVKDGTVTGCFWDIEKSTMIKSAGGKGKVTTEFNQKSNFVDAGWDFSDQDGNPAFWQEVSGSGPILAWQSLVSVPGLIGLTESEAKEVLHSIGILRGKITYSYNDSIEAGITLSQSVEAGEVLATGFEVDLTVSLGTAPRESRIETPEDLINIGQDFDSLGKDYILVNDIDMSGYTFNKAVIAPYDLPSFYFYRGTFDGNGHRILNVNIESDSTFYIGLFGVLAETGVVKNLRIENITIRTKPETGLDRAGCLVGHNYGLVTNCYATGSISCDYASRYVGGLIGSSGYIYNCYTDVDVTVPSPSSEYTGGMVGVGGEIANCFSLGNVFGRRSVGGLSGGHSTVRSSYTSGEVNGFLYVGGITGSGSGLINSYSTGQISGNGFVGGLSGYSSRIINCFTSRAGCHDPLHAEGHEDNVINSFWDSDVSGISFSLHGGGTALTTVEMQTASTFVDAGWDFEGDWWINDGRDYPRLAWQPFGDLNNDCRVDVLDLGIMSANWEMEITGEGVDKRCELSGDGVIGMDDLGVLVDIWLSGPQFVD